jgi:hypothetical protein
MAYRTAKEKYIKLGPKGLMDDSIIPLCKSEINRNNLSYIKNSEMFMSLTSDRSIPLFSYFTYLTKNITKETIRPIRKKIYKDFITKFNSSINSNNFDRYVMYLKQFNFNHFYIY